MKKISFHFTYLFFFTLIASTILHKNSTQATTFLPTSLKEQIKNASYVVLGEISTEKTVRFHKHVKVPYSYWTLSVGEYFSKKKAGKKIEISQPGGKIGEKKYHMEGAANFKKGEVVILMLEDSLEKAKNIRGMHLGKYKLEKNILHSAYGKVVLDRHGKTLQLENFRAFARNVISMKAVEDIKIEVEKESGHGSHSTSKSAH